MTNKNSYLLVLFIVFFNSICLSQFYTPTQLNTIHNSKSAFEGDLYLDTNNHNYYIGLTTGELAKIGDTLDEKIDTVIFQGNNMLVIEGGDTTFFSRDSLGKSEWNDAGLYIYANRAKQAGNDVVVTDNGRVGIGITSPTYKLEVSGTNSDALINSIRVGKGAGDVATNTVVGNSSLSNNTTGAQNTANGYQSLFSNTTGLANTADGYHSLHLNTTGTYNTANGTEALRNNTVGVRNTANGTSALYSNTTGNYNVANGMSSLYYNTTGSNNVANGYQSLQSNTTGFSNTANGHQSLYLNTTGTYNVANGTDALRNNTTGVRNTANGTSALYSNTIGNYNVANGMGSLHSNTSGHSNTANGYQSLYFNTTGVFNNASGMQSLYSNTTGNNNTSYGYQTLYYNTTGNNNTANGFQSLLNTTTGINNTALGHIAGSNITTGNNNIIIGSNISAMSPTADSQLNIGNWIYGDSGDIGIGISIPTEKLDVNGEARIRTLTTGVAADEIVVADATGVLKKISQAAVAAHNEPWFGTDDDMGATLNTENIYTKGEVTIGSSNYPSTDANLTIAMTNNGLDGLDIRNPTTTSSERLVQLVNNAATGVSLYIRHDNATNPQGAIRIDGAKPEIEFVETDQTGSNGKWEIQANGGDFGINSRLANNTAFEKYLYLNGPLSDGGQLVLNAQTNSATRDLFKISNSISSAGAAPGFAWENTAGNLITARLSSAGGSGFNNSNFRIQVADNTKTLQERLRIDVDGNVGIGVTDPNTKLHVDYGTLADLNLNDIRQTTALTLSGSDPGTTSDAKGVSLVMRPIKGRGSVSAITALNDGVNKEGNSNMIFMTGQGGYPSVMKEHMRILGGTGNVIIGGETQVGGATPKLSVQNKIDVLTTGNITPIEILQLSRGGTYGNKWGANVQFKLGSYLSHAYSRSSLDIALTNGNNESIYNTIMTLQGSGYVGIGTTNPLVTLQLGEEDAAARVLRISGAATGSSEGGELQLRVATDFDASLEQYIIDAYQDDLRIRRDGVGNDIILTNSGNVGIGVVNPTYKLEVSDLSLIQGVRVGRGNRTTNTLVGTNALMVNTTGTANTALGYFSLESNTTGGSNTAVGIRTLVQNISGSENTVIGNRAGNNIISGNRNIIIGSNIDAPSGTAHDQLNIGNWIYGVNGDIGIGTTAPAHKLQVIGTAGLSTGTAWTNTSDLRLKDIQGDYKYGLEEILALNTVRFNYKKDNPLQLPSDVNLVGFIAQEVQKVIPEAVTTREDGYLELNVDPIHWAMVNAFKEQQQQIEGLEVKVKNKEKENIELKKQLNSILERLNQLEKK